jgi:hypothetical protein
LSQLKNLIISKDAPLHPVTPIRYRKVEFKFLRRETHPRTQPRKAHRNIKAFGKQINLLVQPTSPKPKQPRTTVCSNSPRRLVTIKDFHRDDR